MGTDAQVSLLCRLCLALNIGTAASQLIAAASIADPLLPTLAGISESRRILSFFCNFPVSEITRYRLYASQPSSFDVCWRASFQYDLPTDCLLRKNGRTIPSSLSPDEDLDQTTTGTRVDNQNTRDRNTIMPDGALWQDVDATRLLTKWKNAGT